MELLRFYAETFVRLAKHLQELETCLYIDETERRSEEEHGSAPACTTDWEGYVIPTLNRAQRDIDTINLVVTSLHNSELLKAAAHQTLTAADVKSLHQNMDRELSTHFFIGIPQDRKAAYCEPFKGWEEILRRFEGITRDVEEMSKCFSLSRYTAAMFHAMQIAERGAIELGDCIGVTDPKKGWGATEQKLTQLIKGGHKQLPSELEGKFEFLEQMHREINSMTLAWRNKIDHAANRLAIVPNTDFTPDIAEHIAGSVRVFFLRLAEGMPPPTAEDLFFGIQKL